MQKFEVLDERRSSRKPKGYRRVCICLYQLQNASYLNGFNHQEQEYFDSYFNVFTGSPSSTTEFRTNS